MKKFEVEFSYYIESEEGEVLCTPSFEINEDEKKEFIDKKLKEIAYNGNLKSSILVKEIKSYKVL